MISLAEMLREGLRARLLTAKALARVEPEIVERTFPVGGHVCRKGERVEQQHPFNRFLLLLNGRGSSGSKMAASSSSTCRDCGISAGRRRPAAGSRQA